MDKKAFSEISEHLKSAASSGILSSSDRVALREGCDIYVTSAGANLKKLAAKDLELLPESGVFQASSFEGIVLAVFSTHERLNAAVLCGAPYGVSVSRAGETVRPYVDDIAQIIGVNIKCRAASDVKGICSQLKRRNAVLIKDSGVLCAGGSLDDALAAAMIAEKACAIHVQGGYIGGVKAVNPVEAALMRFIYLKKYSKSAKLAK